MEAWILLIVILICSSLSMSSISGATVYFLDKSQKQADFLEEQSTAKVGPTPAFLQQYLQQSNTVNCQEIANKYNVYPPKASIYLPAGDPLNKWNIAGCNVYPNQSTSFSNIYSRFRDSPSNFAPYVGKTYALSNLANASERLTLNVEQGPKFCVYTNGSLDRCTNGAPASGNFKLKITQNGNLCLIDPDNNNYKAWCALSPDLDNGNLCSGSSCPSTAITADKLANARLLTIDEYQNTHRTARLQNGKFCLYPDASPTSAPLWCNK